MNDNKLLQEVYKGDNRIVHDAEMLTTFEFSMEIDFGVAKFGNVWHVQTNIHYLFGEYDKIEDGYNSQIRFVKSILEKKPELKGKHFEFEPVKKDVYHGYGNFSLRNDMLFVVPLTEVFSITKTTVNKTFMITVPIKEVSIWFKDVRLNGFEFMCEQVSSGVEERIQKIFNEKLIKLISETFKINKSNIEHSGDRRGGAYYAFQNPMVLTKGE